MEIDTAAAPTNRLIAKLRRQKRNNRYKCEDLGQIRTREDAISAGIGEEKEEYIYQWEKDKFMKVKKPGEKVSTIENWSARWFTLRCAYAIAMVLPMPVTQMHKRRIKTTHRTLGGMWTLIERAERMIRLAWVSDIGSTDYYGVVRTFTMAAMRENQYIWQREVIWRVPQGRAPPTAKVDGEQDADGEEEAIVRKAPKAPKNKAKGGGKQKRGQVVNTFSKGGKTIEICKDFNKPGGCKRGKNCRFKQGHVCCIKGCRKAQPAHSHSH